MKESEEVKTRILSHLQAEDFIGRTREIAEVLRHANGATASSGMLILSAPTSGLSELLRQIYDQLFEEQGEIIPLYFSFSKNDRTPEQTARHFLQTILSQIIAFRRGDPKILDSAPDICEISELALAADKPWIEPLVSACDLNSCLKDERSFVKQAFSAPFRAKAHGLNVFVMFDNFHYVEQVRNGLNLLDELKELYRRSTVRFVFGGRRRYLLNAVQSGNTKLTETEVLRLNTLPNASATALIENLSGKSGVKVTPQTVDLLVQQFCGNPSAITSIFLSAQENRQDLDTFQKVQQIYVDSVLGSWAGRSCETLFDEVTPSLEIQKKIINLLANEERKTPLDTWRERLELPENEFRGIIKSLHVNEIIRLNSGVVEFPPENQTLNDCVRARYRLEVAGEARALVVGKTLADALKRAPKTMTRLYRRASAIGLRELLSVFNCQTVPADLFDYGRFKEFYKGAEEQEIVALLEKNSARMTLPQIVYTANCVAFYPPINQFLEDERSAVAFGFETGNYLDESEVVWIAVEADSKLEAAAELTEFWCDRLEMVALMCNFLNYRLWLITPEGFSPEALEILRQRNALGSSRRQVELLIKHLKAEKLITDRRKPNEYELVVPMGDDTEMISAHAVEDIARRHNFTPRAINQIKTALVEACINAAEHSHSPDRRIYQKFVVDEEKIVITVSNRGLKIPAAKIANVAAEIDPAEGRRGWGLKLIRNLMDEVTFEQVDDGSCISMVKYKK